MTGFDPASTVVSRFGRRLPDGRVRCELCPRLCCLAEGQRGFCFVRGAADGHIVLTTFGRASGFCVDPIEKKPLAHFLPGSSVLSFGTAGCNLGCRFCQNWDISKSRETRTLADRADPDTIARAAADLRCASVAFTYNDPVIFHEYAVATARACHDRGVQTVAVTAGYVCAEPRVEFFQHMDAANVDLKAFTERFYRELCGASLEPVLDTLRYVHHETPCWLEITTLLIPNENDGDDEVARLAAWIASDLSPDVPLHLTAFHPDWRLVDRPATTAATLRRARQIARRSGLRHVYTGNVHDPEGARTICPSCSTLLIGRDGYHVTAWHLDAKARCRRCSETLVGVFEPVPGQWGGRRQPVRLEAYRGEEA